MKQIIDAFLTIFLVLILVFVGVGVVQSSLEGQKAQAFLYDCTDMIESSNYSSTVISELQTNAEAQDYEWVIDLTQNSEGVYTGGRLTLTYQINIPFIGYSSDKEATAILH